MANHKIILQELRDYRWENKEQLKNLKEDLTKVNDRLKEAKERTQKDREKNAKHGGNYDQTCTATHTAGRKDDGYGESL